MSSPGPTSPPPPKPRPDHAPAAPSGEAPAEKPPIDLRRLPSGHVPAAWKDLPPPQIVRAEPKPERNAKLAVAAALKTRAAKQILLGVGGVLLIALIVWSFIPRPTLNTPLGTVQLYGRALEARDLAAMQAATTGLATSLCEGVLASITVMEREGQASRFTTARPVTGGAPAGDTASGYIVCEGENGDDFLRVNVNLQRQPDGTWRIHELGTESLTGQ